MSRSNLRLFIASLMLCLFVLAGCDGGSSSVSLHSQQIGPENGIAVGGLMPLTGSLGRMGTAAFATLEPALDDVNGQLSIRGLAQRMKLVIYDTESAQDVALRALEALHGAGVRLVIGPYDSETAAALLDYANKNGMVLVSPNSTAPSLAIAGDNLLRLLPDDGVQAQGLAKLMWDQGQRVCVPIYRDDMWGREFSAALADKFTAMGGQMAEAISYSPNTGNFSTVLSTVTARVNALLAARPAGEVAVQLCSAQEGISLLAEARGHDVLAQVHWYGSDGLARAPQLLQDADASQFAATTGFACATFSQDPAVLTTPALVLQDMALRETLYNRAQSTADSWILTTWDAVWLIATGMVATNFPQDGLLVRDSMLALSAKHLGISAHLRLEPTGDRKYGDYGIYRVHENAGGNPEWELFAAYNWVFGVESFRYVQETAPENLTGGPEVLEIGALLPLTGEGASSGASVQAGLLEAVVDINRHLARSGYVSASGNPTQVSVVVEDTASDPATALSKLQQLHNRGITTVIGPCLSSVLANVLDYANRNGMVLLSPSSDAPSLAGAGDNLFRFVPNAVRQGKVVAEMMWREGARVLVPLWRDDVWGNGLKAATVEEFTALGGQVLAGASYAPGTTDFSSILEEAATQIAGAAAGQVAVDVVSLDEGVTILHQAAGYPQLSAAVWYGSEALANSGAFTQDPTAASFGEAQGFLCPAYALEILGMADSIPLSIPRYALMTRIQLRLQQSPGTYGYTAWDTLWVAVLANIRADWSTDAATLDQSIMTLSRGLIGVSNSLALDAAGDRAAANYDFYLLQQQDSGPGWKKYGTYFSNPFGDEPKWFLY